MTAFTVQEGSEEQKCAFRRSETITWINVSHHLWTHFEAQEAPLEALLGPSWGSKLGSQRLKECAFRVGETLFFAFGGRLKEKAKPTKAEEPQKEAKDAGRSLHERQKQAKATVAFANAKQVGSSPRLYSRRDAVESHGCKIGQQSQPCP